MSRKWRCLLGSASGLAALGWVMLVGCSEAAPRREGGPDATGGAAGAASGGSSGSDLDAGVSGSTSDIVSGSRLRASYLATDDGTRVFQGWYDSELKLPCHFTTAEDGALRCLPDTSVSVREHVFLDNQCSQRLVQVQESSCSAKPTHVLYSTSDGCNATTEVYALGAPQAVTQVFRPSATGCDPSEVGPSQRFYALGAKVDAAAFVDGFSVAAPTTQRLDPLFVRASDGAMERIGWFDTQHNLACDVSIASDKKPRCLPVSSAVVLDSYVDASCTKPVAQLFTSAGCAPSEPPGVAFKIDTNACPVVQHVYAVTAKLESRQVYQKLDSACEATDALADVSYYETSELAPSTFDAFSEALRGDARLRLPVLVNSTGASELRPGLFDSLRNEPCAFERAADGQTRCLPDGATEFFSDQNCTQRIAGSIASCGSTTPRYAKGFTGDLCAGGFRLYALGDRITPSAVYIRNPDGSCGGVGSPAATFYAVGTELNLSDFVAASPITE